MRARWATAMRFGRHGLAPILVLLVVVVLRLLGLGAHGPLWIVALVLLTAAMAGTARTLHRAVAQRERAEHALRHAEERFRALIRDGSEIITEAGVDGSISYVSPAAWPIMGYRSEQLLGTAMDTLVHPDDQATAVALHARALTGDAGVEQTAEIRIQHADGRWHWHAVTLRNLLGHPEVRAIVGHYRDVTEQRIARDQVAHDDLTGLANTPTLTRDLERALAHGTRYRHAVGLLFLHLDGFALVHDTYGRAVGDQLLSTVSDVLRRTVRDTDTVGRLGSGEFGIVLSQLGGAEEALAVASRIIGGITRNSSVAGLSLDVGASIGAAMAYPGGSDATTLIRHADAAAERSKLRGRNGAQLYVEEETIAPWLI
jgi:diguanylate cyclase (GGDEF)-like protein/PAS domain S-box-containing protein